MSDRRVPFFVASALVCGLLVPLSEPGLRWVPVATGATYLVLALLVFLDWLGRRRAARPRREPPRGSRGRGSET